MAGFELRLHPLAVFEAAPEAGGEQTVVIGGDLGEEARVYAASSRQLRGGRTEMEHAGTLVIARREEDVEVIHATFPEKDGQRPLARERAMAILTFAMLTDHHQYGDWRGDEQVFVDLANQDGVDPSYLAAAGIRIHRARRKEEGETELRVINIAQSLERVAGKNQSELRRVQAYPSVLPEGYQGVTLWLEEEKGAA